MKITVESTLSGLREDFDVRAELDVTFHPSEEHFGLHQGPVPEMAEIVSLKTEDGFEIAIKGSIRNIYDLADEIIDDNLDLIVESAKNHGE